MEILQQSGFKAPAAAIQRNSAHQENNVAYVFGRLKSPEKSMAFSFNGARMEVPDGSFYRYPMRAGETVKISKGGPAGAFVSFRNQEDTSARFWALSGMALWVPPTMPGFSAIGVSTGGIAPLNKSFGRMLVALLRRQQMATE